MFCSSHISFKNVFNLNCQFGEIGALPTDEFGKIGASVGEVGASAKNHSERLEHYIFGKMGALDSERLEYPLVYAYA